MKKHDIIENFLQTKDYEIISLSAGINQSYQIKSNNSYFFKYSEDEDLRLEAYELGLLSKYVCTPEVLESGVDYLFLSWVDVSYNLSAGKELGRSLARLHQQEGDYFGFEFDNKIGITKQLNPQSQDWANFYWQYRLYYQIELAKDKLNNNDYNYLSSLKNSIIDVLAIDVKPVLLHGDLWSGNYLADANNVYLIDSACYYGHSEADLALSYIFGGFDKNFYNEYFKLIPQQHNFEQRKYVYMLYHYLNHLNIFGSVYYSGTMNCAKNILKNYD